MRHKTIDGIRKLPTNRPHPEYIFAIQAPYPRPTLKSNLPANVLAAIGFFMLASFVAGVLTVLESRQTSAEDNSPAVIPQVLGAHAESAKDQELQELSDAFGQLLQQYRQLPTADELAQAVRREKLRAYLAVKRSPWAEDEATLDALLQARNMRMILAISFVESNFGKRCANKNCSGIGVEPGHQLWREYDSYAHWVSDFDGLLERKYKDWTPEEMRGVYVQPGSANWVNGIKQILAELQQGDI